MDKPMEYISLASLIEHEELVVSQVPSFIVPEDDREPEDFYSLRVWRPSRGDFTDTMRWKDRFKAIVSVFFTGRVASNSVVLSKYQLLQLSKWIYLHGEEDPVPSRD